MGTPVYGLIRLDARLFLKMTRRGRFICSICDNPAAARITGVPMRPTIVIQYPISAVIGYGAGLLPLAIVFDSLLNPRDDLTARQGDIRSGRQDPDIKTGGNAMRIAKLAPLAAFCALAGLGPGSAPRRPRGSRIPTPRPITRSSRARPSPSSLPPWAST